MLLRPFCGLGPPVDPLHVRQQAKQHRRPRIRFDRRFKPRNRCVGLLAAQLQLQQCVPHERVGGIIAHALLEARNGGFGLARARFELGGRDLEVALRRFGKPGIREGIRDGLTRLFDSALLRENLNARQRALRAIRVQIDRFGIGSDRGLAVAEFQFGARAQQQRLEMLHRIRTNRFDHLSRATGVLYEQRHARQLDSQICTFGKTEESLIENPDGVGGLTRLQHQRRQLDKFFGRVGAGAQRLERFEGACAVGALKRRLHVDLDCIALVGLVSWATGGEQQPRRTHQSPVLHARTMSDSPCGSGEISRL